MYGFFVVSRQQIHSLYSGEAVKKSSPPPKKQNNKSSIPAALIPAAKQKSTSSVPHKPKPKNLEAGLKALNIAELETLVDSYRNNFTESHVVWLKAVRMRGPNNHTPNSITIVPQNNFPKIVCRFAEYIRYFSEFTIFNCRPWCANT